MAQVPSATPTSSLKTNLETNNHLSLKYGRMVGAVNKYFAIPSRMNCSNASEVLTDVGETIHRLRKEQGELKRQLADVDNQLIDALAEMKARLFALDFSREAAGIVANLPALRKGPQSSDSLKSH